MATIQQQRQYTRKRKNRQQVPHFITGLGDGNVHPKVDIDGRHNHRQDLPHQPIPERNAPGGAGGVGVDGGDKGDNSGGGPYVRARNSEQKRASTLQKVDVYDDILLLHPKVIKHGKPQAIQNFPSFGTAHTSDDGSWQITVFALLGIIGMLVVLFLHLVSEPQPLGGAGSGGGGGPSYRRTRPHRRNYSLTRTKKKTDEWSVDEAPTDVDEDYPADTEAVGTSSSSRTARSTTPGSTLYYPRYNNPPQQQSRLRKTAAAAAAGGTGGGGGGGGGGGTVIGDEAGGGPVNSRPYFHRTTPGSVYVTPGTSTTTATTASTSVQQQQESTTSASHLPSSPKKYTPVETTIAAPTSQQQTTAAAGGKQATLRHRRSASSDMYRAPSAMGNDLGLGTGLEGFDISAAAAAAAAAAAVMPTPTRSRKSSIDATDMTSRSRKSSADITETLPRPHPVGGVGTSSSSPVVGGMSPSAAKTKIAAASAKSTADNTGRGNTSATIAHRPYDASPPQSSLFESPSASESEELPEREQMIAHGRGTEHHFLSAHTSPSSSSWGESTDEETGDFVMPRPSGSTPGENDADDEMVYSPTGLKRRHAASSLIVTPGHEDMETPRAGRRAKPLMLAPRDEDSGRGGPEGGASSMPSPPQPVASNPLQDRMASAAQSPSPAGNMAAQPMQVGGNAVDDSSSPVVVGGVPLPFIPTLDEKEKRREAPRSICIDELHLVHMESGEAGDGPGSRWGTTVEEGISLNKDAKNPLLPLSPPPPPPLYRKTDRQGQGKLSTSQAERKPQAEGIGRGSITPHRREGDGSNAARDRSSSEAHENDPRKSIKHKRDDLTQSTDASSSLTSSIKFSELKLQDVIGGGGFGQVWRATWKGTPVAVKILTGSAQTENVPKYILEEFAAEINMVSGMRHPNICLYIGACLDPPNRAIVTELAANGSLWDALRTPLSPPYVAADGITRNAWPLTLYYSPAPRVTTQGSPCPPVVSCDQTPFSPAGTWPWILVKRVASGAARGMTYLHSGNPPVLHRDLKSANLLLDDSYTAKVTDFGLSRLKAQERSMTGNCGTVQWMAPEVLANQRYAEPADVYSFGIILWELLSRECPYEGMSPIQCALAVLNKNQRPEIPVWCPPAFAALIKSCVERNPSSRPTFAQIISALDAMP